MKLIEQNFSEFVLESKLYEAVSFLLEQQIQIFPDFVDILMSIEDQDEISKIILRELNDRFEIELEDDEHSKIKNIERIHIHPSKPDYVMVVSVKPDGTEITQDMKIGKLVTAILAQIKKKSNFKPQDVEKFVRKVNAIRTGEVPNDYEFKLVEGKDIVKYYNQKQYEKMSGDLGNSCMSYASCSSSLQFYAKDCKDVVKLLIYVNKETDKIAGRALVWKTNKGLYLDRIYVQDDKIRDVFRNWGDYNVSAIFDPTRIKDISVFVKGWNKNDKEMPYMDTFELGFMVKDGLWLWVPNHLPPDYSKFPGGKDEILGEYRFRNTDGEIDILSEKFTWDRYEGMKDICVQDLHLKTLEGCPEVVGRFDCSTNDFETLEGGPKRVEKDFSCYRCLKLKNLVGGPTFVGEGYDCDSCSLTSLEGVPKIIYGEFDCSHNQLKTLEYFPEEVHENVFCESNPGRFTEKDIRAVCKVKGLVFVK